jgi:MFS family permease
MGYGTLPDSEDKRAHPGHVALLTSVGVFCGCSCWFATNAAIRDIAAGLGNEVEILVATTGATQCGFIIGTFISAAICLADLTDPKIVFAISCFLAGVSTAAVLAAESVATLVAVRLFTGFSLAGVYPIGLKIVSSWHDPSTPRGSGVLGSALGSVVGAVVLGTAFPHALAAMGAHLPAREVFLTVAAMSIVGGVIVGIFGTCGPYHKRAARCDPCAVREIFTDPLFRANAFGYFGHNWELYALWAFLPTFIRTWEQHAGVDWYGSVEAAHSSVHALTFATIATGSLACFAGGWTESNACMAFSYLALSGLCCVLSPIVIIFAPFPVLVVFLVCWGWVVVGDSPHFSALSARLAPPGLTASAITSVVCLGFVLTVASVAAVGFALAYVDNRYVFALLLAPGPVLGLVGFRPVVDAGL